MQFNPMHPKGMHRNDRCGRRAAGPVDVSVLPDVHAALDIGTHRTGSRATVARAVGRSVRGFGVRSGYHAKSGKPNLGGEIFAGTRVAGWGRRSRRTGAHAGLGEIVVAKPGKDANWAVEFLLLFARSSGRAHQAIALHKARLLSWLTVCDLSKKHPGFMSRNRERPNDPSLFGMIGWARAGRREVVRPNPG